MSDLTLREAQLLRLLSGFFGRDNIHVKLSLWMVCGGRLPGNVLEVVCLRPARDVEELEVRARETRCLFTVVNAASEPCLVVELESPATDAVDLADYNRKVFLQPLLQAAEVPCIVVGLEDLEDMLNPGSTLDLFALLRDKFEVGG